MKEPSSTVHQKEYHYYLGDLTTWDIDFTRSLACLRLNAEGQERYRQNELVEVTAEVEHSCIAYILGYARLATVAVTQNIILVGLVLIVRSPCDKYMGPTSYVSAINS